MQATKQARLDMVEAENIVANLNRRYVRCLDQLKISEWADFFDDAGRYLIQPRDNHDAGFPGGHWMYFPNKGMIKDRVTSLIHINKFHKRYDRHILGDTLVTKVVDGIIHASTSYYLAQTSYDGHVSLFSVGEYLDQVILVDGESRFLEKFVVPDSFNSHGAVIFPI